MYVHAKAPKPLLYVRKLNCIVMIIRHYIAKGYDVSHLPIYITQAMQLTTVMLGNCCFL